LILPNQKYPVSFSFLFSQMSTNFQDPKFSSLLATKRIKEIYFFFTQYLCGTPFCVTEMQNASVELWLLSWVHIRTEFGPVSFEVGTGPRAKSATPLRNNYVQ
jgi:hypothetical protein